MANPCLLCESKHFAQPIQNFLDLWTISLYIVYTITFVLKLQEKP